MLDAQLALRRIGIPPEATAIVQGEQRIRYSDLKTAVKRAAGNLSARGVRRGDRLRLLFDDVLCRGNLAF